jgi:hypothetical protein
VEGDGGCGSRKMYIGEAAGTLKGELSSTGVGLVALHHNACNVITTREQDVPRHIRRIAIVFHFMNY